MSAQHYAQGLRDAAEWVERNAEAIDANGGVFVVEGLGWPIYSPPAWASLVAASGDIEQCSGYVAASTWFGPIEMRLTASNEVATAASELTGEVSA